MQRPGAWALVLASLAVLAVGLAGFYYFTGEAATLPLRQVPHLETVPLTLEQLPLGAVQLPVQVSGFIVSLTHDLGGPLTQPVAAGIFLTLLALALTGWLAVASTLSRIPFAIGMGPVVFLWMSLDTASLRIFEGHEQLFLYLALGLLLGGAYALQAFGESVQLGRRWLLLGVLVAALSALLLTRSALPLHETVLHLAAAGTLAGAVLVLLVVLWVAIENVRILLWLNTQAEQPASRFGLGVFLTSSLLYLGTLFWLWWNDGQMTILPGLRLDPLVLLLPAVLAGGLGLRQRAPSYASWLPYRAGADQLYPALLAAAAGALAYAFATANTPLLDAARELTTVALLLLGAAFLLYILINFLPLISQKLKVYRVVFEPRRLPFYTVYIMGVVGIGLLQLRAGWPLANQALAGQYNNFGDLARQQSEANPDDLALAVLAERYYAESGDVLYRSNRKAQLGRAALYRFRQQRRNELKALDRGLQRGPDERVSLRLGALLGDKEDLFQALDVLREGLQDNPRSEALANDLAQRFTQTTLTDSVAHYLDRAEALAPGNYASRTNQLAFLLQQGLLTEAATLSSHAALANEPALTSNQLLRALLQNQQRPAAPTGFASLTDLDNASFAQLYHAALLGVRQRRATLLPTLTRLNKQPANEPYYEQLVFLQALTLHAVGQEQAARLTLAPLAAGSSATAAYYQQLFGIWQLQQGQFGTAARQFALAAAHGVPSANLGRAYALARTGQPDSARAVLARLQAAPDSTLHPAAQALAQAMATGNMPAAPAAPVAGTALLAQARQAEQQKPGQATKLYQRLLREAPFNETAVLAAGRFYTQRRNYPAAYEALRLGLDENPVSLPLLRAYVLAAADAGLTDYATEAMAQLQQQLPAADFAALQATYAQHRAARAAAADAFETR
ncbi:hypothetical protein Q5H93_18010 [Hymenobacter sp. ASUV-10]|uniref:Tetratricopeptide repeat protein n=2 Tax=Hymenobacter aranciens TaxID=3063996 RepID=A0ABT9BEF7_9BACT|nr:hypothetical protein [Hymenobacter sp. ASUV-10]